MEKRIIPTETLYQSRAILDNRLMELHDLLLNNQMDDFSLDPGVPNAFGLVGAHANSVAPGKRPLSSMSPTLVTRNGEPVMTLGAAGGPTIISQVTQVLLRYLAMGQSLEEAMH